MGIDSIWHWLVVLAIVMILFGAGKIPRLMGDLAKGVKAFKQGMRDDDETPSAGGQAPRQLNADQPAAQPTAPERSNEPSHH